MTPFARLYDFCYDPCAVTPAPTPPPCENHTGITGPEYPGLKLRNGELPNELACECHSCVHAACAGSDASPTWHVPYQEHNLRADLKALECNLASCNNPRPAVAILSRLCLTSLSLLGMLAVRAAFQCAEVWL